MVAARVKEPGLFTGRVNNGYVCLPFPLPFGLLAACLLLAACCLCLCLCLCPSPKPWSPLARVARERPSAYHIRMVLSRVFFQLAHMLSLHTHIKHYTEQGVEQHARGRIARTPCLNWMVVEHQLSQLYGVGVLFQSSPAFFLRFLLTSSRGCATVSANLKEQPDGQAPRTQVDDRRNAHQVDY